MLDVLMLPFFQRALLVGLTLGILLAILGAFVVMRRLAFFADAIGHSALTGIALALLLSINPFVGALAFTLLVATGIAFTKQRIQLSLDILLGVFYAAAVSLGVILIQLTPGYQADLVSFLFGDILTVSSFDLVLSITVAIAILIVVLIKGKAFVAITLNQDLAHAEGITVARHELLFLLLLATTIALTIKLVGVVLVTGMLIIPAAAAQNVARSLSWLFILSVIGGSIAVVLGLMISASFNLPSGPAIVLTGAGLFTLSLLYRPRLGA